MILPLAYETHRQTILGYVLAYDNHSQIIPGVCCGVQKIVAKLYWDMVWLRFLYAKLYPGYRLIMIFTGQNTPLV